MNLEPSGGVMGAVVRDLDLSDGPDEIAPDLAEALNQALLDHHLLCLRGLDLTKPQFLAIGQVFGTPQVQFLKEYRTNDMPEITVISNYNSMAGGKPHVRATHWHTDDSYLAVPAKATMLHGRAMPSRGGDTQFINTHAVLDAMPDAMRARIEGRRAVHKYKSRRALVPVAVRTEAEEAATPEVVHPLIRIHPETGRAALYINPNRLDRVDDMDLDEGDALLDELYEFAFRDEFQFRHQWQLGDVVIWDNRCTMHRASTDFDVTELREFHRILLKGDVPV